MSSPPFILSRVVNLISKESTGLSFSNAHMGSTFCLSLGGDFLDSLAFFICGRQKEMATFEELLEPLKTPQTTWSVCLMETCFCLPAKLGSLLIWSPYRDQTVALFYAGPPGSRLVRGVYPVTEIEHSEESTITFGKGSYFVPGRPAIH